LLGCARVCCCAVLGCVAGLCFGELLGCAGVCCWAVLGCVAGLC
jgi:hypothetical protein